MRSRAAQRIFDLEPVPGPPDALAVIESDDSERNDRLIMSWDIALSETETGDYSACVVLLRRGEVFYVLEVMRGRFPFGTLKRKVMEVKERYNSGTLLIEDSPISRGLIQSLQEQSINVTTHKPETDKRARVIAQTDLFAGGSVRSKGCVARGVHRRIVGLSRPPR